MAKLALRSVHTLSGSHIAIYSALAIAPQRKACNLGIDNERPSHALVGDALEEKMYLQHSIKRYIFLTANIHRCDRSLFATLNLPK